MPERRVSRPIIAGLCLTGVLTLAAVLAFLLSDTTNTSISTRHARSSRAGERTPTSDSSAAIQSADPATITATPGRPATDCALTDQLRAEVITAIGSKSWVVSDAPVEFATGGGEPFPLCKIMLFVSRVLVPQEQGNLDRLGDGYLYVSLATLQR